MTFNDLHDGIGQGCDCLNQPGVSENTHDFFARAISQEALSMDDLKSYHEMGMLARYKLSCRAKCMRRGVSINKLNGNEAAIKAKWESVGLFSPQGGNKSFVCMFQLKTGAGKVWDTSSNRPEDHNDLLKADGFSLASVEVKAIVPIALF